MAVCVTVVSVTFIKAFFLSPLSVRLCLGPFQRVPAVLLGRVLVSYGVSQMPRRPLARVASGEISHISSGISRRKF